MTENQLPVQDTSAEETGRVRPAIEAGDGGVHIPREPVTHVEARPAGNYLADSSNGVQITLAHFSAAGSASVASAYDPDYEPDYEPEPDTRVEEAHDSKLEIWLLAAAVISVTTLFTGLYTIRNPQLVPSFVAQTLNFSKQLSAHFKRRASTTLGGTAVTDTAKAGSIVRDVGPLAPVSLPDADRSAAQDSGSSSGAHQTLASDRDETGTRENSRRHTQNVNHTARSNAGDTRSGVGMLVPPPPPTPYVLAPASGFFTMQPGQQQATLQQQLQQAQAQASLKTHNQAAARKNTPTEGTQTAELGDAEQELQAALKSSLHTVGEWTR